MHGITKFMDLTQQEFSAQYLGSSRPATSSGDLRSVRSSVQASDSAATSVDWAGVLTTPVKDQVLLVLVASD